MVEEWHGEEHGDGTADEGLEEQETFGHSLALSKGTELVQPETGDGGECAEQKIGREASRREGHDKAKQVAAQHYECKSSHGSQDSSFNA